MVYRKEIDGLRAVAILPVIWLHSGLPYISGGFIGVDVFFVISGFLITTILMNESENGNFSLLQFYERRARRILPALVVVIIITSIFVPFISVHPKYISDFGDSVLSTVFFVSNIYFWITSGYFGSASELSPMLHTWSLAVEEQYYIFFPLLIMLIFPFGRKVIIATLCLISICSLLIAEWGAVNSPNGNFYLLPSRAWELMAGALAAIFYLNASIIKIRSKFSPSLSTIGFSLILYAYFLFTSTTLHPTSITLLPVLGTVMVLLFASQSNYVGRILSFKLLNFIGLISYSLYLWHQPVLALMKRLYSIHLEPIHIVTAIIIIFTLSYLTWRYVENPFRNRKKHEQNKIFQLSIISMLIVSFCGLLFKESFHIRKMLQPQQMERYEAMLEADKSHTNQAMFNSGCKFWSNEFNSGFIKRFEECTEVYDKAVFILGGSHGMDLYNAVAMNAPAKFIVSVSRGFCRAHRFVHELNIEPKCQYEDFKEFAQKYSDHISVVLYTQTPDSLFNTQSFYNTTTADLAINRVDEVVDYLSEIKINYSLNVLMIGMLPPLSKSPIDWSYKLPIEDQFNSIVTKNSIDLTKYVDSVFELKLKKHDIVYITKFEGFQLNIPTDLINEGGITYSDKRHISNNGEKLFGTRLIDYLNKNGFSEFSNNPEQ
jgi:peptidoglycan/LPS O-acetylase OafA/YrhL